MLSFLVFVTINKSYSFCGSKYAADGIKPILCLVLFYRKLKQYQP